MVSVEYLSDIDDLSHVSKSDLVQKLPQLINRNILLRQSFGTGLNEFDIPIAIPYLLWTTGIDDDASS